MSDEAKEALAFLAVVVLIIGGIVFWIWSCSNEAATYNKLTGGHATTWDAMWTELRVATPERITP